MSLKDIQDIARATLEDRAAHANGSDGGAEAGTLVSNSLPTPVVMPEYEKAPEGMAELVRMFAVAHREDNGLPADSRVEFGPATGLLIAQIANTLASVPAADTTHFGECGQ